MTNPKILARRVLGGLAVVAAASALAATPALAGPAQHAAPACRPARLSVSLDGVDAGAGQRYTTLDISTAGLPCTITGIPTGLTFLDANGAALATTPIVEGPAATPVTVTATSPAQLVLHTSPVDVEGDLTISPSALSFYLPGARTATTIAWQAGEVDGNGSVQFGAIQAAPTSS
ncbi:MAG TPA: DUF4232 domain-containing protein [Pseudonocardiaceae bacterium]|nr:DUF4232 domain-containing protein [Pseudonocardiaceae bacterium]